MTLGFAWKHPPTPRRATLSQVLLLLVGGILVGAGPDHAWAATPTAASTPPPASPTPTTPPARLPTAATANGPVPFSVIAIGCMPYARLPESTAAYQRVLEEINRHRPAFAVHLGDIMGSEEHATDALFTRRLTEFDSIQGALIFTPGDNEWTDVHRTAGYHPPERLDRIRQIFFAEERSRGRLPIPLITQRRDPAYAKYVENARWVHGSVLFATVHVVGSNNNRQTNVTGAMTEWHERDQANAAWLQATFLHASEIQAPGVALFCQANPVPGNPGFALFLATLSREARAFGRPVLLVHADEHRYRLDPGFQTGGPGTAPVPNLTRVETFGASDFHGVSITVDPSSEPVFLAGPLIVPGNPLPRLPRPTPPAARNP